MQKGITPVIAVILLLLITIAIVGFSFIFFQRVAVTSTQAGEEQLQQQTGQVSTRFAIENVDKNRVTIRNLGAAALSGLQFYVNDVPVDSNNVTIPANSVGTAILHDGQLAQLPDPATLRVSASGYSDTTTANFYGKYTVGYWKLDEGSGTAATDASGNGNDGTCSATACPAWAAGKYGNALSFDGSNDKITVRNNTNLDMTSSLTISFWMKAPVDTRWYPRIVSRMDFNNNKGYMFSLNMNANTIGFLVGNGAAVTPTGGSYAANEWTHITGTFSQPDLKMYVNGVLTGTATMASPITNHNADLLIGDGYDGGVPFNGALDEVRILNVARSMTIA